MQKLKKIILLLAIISIPLSIGIIVKAQEAATTTSGTEEITATDLEVAEPTILPDNPVYFMKNWMRGLSLTFTPDKIKRAQLENKYSNEKLLEIKKMVKNNADPEKIKAATDKYQQGLVRVKEIIDKIKETASSNEDVSKFLDKFTKQQTLQGKVLEQLQGQVPEKVLQKIKEARNQQLERFKDVMLKLEDKNKIPERLQEALKGGDDNVSDVLDALKEKMPDDIKQKIDAAKENIRGKVNEKLIEKATEKNADKNCPAVQTPVADFCPKGIIKVERDNGGCATSFSCLMPGQNSAAKLCKEDSDCPRPQCNNLQAEGEGCPSFQCRDGKCQLVLSERPSCKELWWFDKNSTECKQKKFCGLFMYQSLQTFTSENECKTKLSAATQP